MHTYLYTYVTPMFHMSKLYQLQPNLSSDLLAGCWPITCALDENGTLDIPISQHSSTAGSSSPSQKQYKHKCQETFKMAEE